MWWFRGALGGKVYSLHSLQPETGSRKDRSLQRGRSSRFLRFLVHTRVAAAGHKLGGGAGHCLLDCGDLSHP